MSKYDPLWEHLRADGRDGFSMSFDEIADVLGFEIDHSFLNYKKDAADHGYHVGKISLKEKRVMFSKTDDRENL